MPNTHLEHPEDLILTGDLSVFDDLYGNAFHISLKMDGAPAVVWGTHNDRFFVCTKSAFNKKKIKLCYTVDDIYQHFGHQDDVADILYLMLKYLPRVEGVYQGDFLGFGRKREFSSNTLTYIFNEKVDQKIVIAPHTKYYVDGELCDAVPLPLREKFSDTAHVRFVMPIVDRIHPQHSAPKINTSVVQFLTDKEAKKAKQVINAVIKSGQELDDETLTEILGCQHLANLYQWVIEIKEDLIDSMIVYNDFKTYLPNGEETVGEGFVYWTQESAIKLVNRSVFSYANFTEGRFG
mgnify:CR=1 FL=1|tara:strand:- start:1940 stop:2818 length:879 start_codon:yes stop_codon:yes gene_type:complete